MPLEHFHHSAGHIRTHHRAGIDSPTPCVSPEIDRLNAAISTVEEVQVHRSLRRGSFEMSFDADPPRLTVSRPDGIQVRPPSGSVHHSLRLKLSSGRAHHKWPRASNFLYGNLLAHFRAHGLGGMPKRVIKIEPRDAGRRRENRRLKHPIVEEHSRALDPYRITQQRAMGRIEQIT